MTSMEFITSQWFKIPFQLVLSCITIYMTLLAGNKKPNAWKIGLYNQILWATYIVATQSWGLTPMCLALTFVYLRNHFKWNAQP